MHTTHGPLGTTFHHNGDFSGLVKFLAPCAAAQRSVDVEAPFSALVRAAVLPGYWGSVDVRREDNDEMSEVEVPIADLRALVGRRVRDARISSLEEAEPEELFASAVDREIAAWAGEPVDWA
jgi:hypothetical protein